METARVLVVDDSRIFRGELTRAVQELGGYRVVGSEFNGRRALDFLAQHPVDIVTLDLAMPGMSGSEVLERIQAREWPGGRPAVVVVTGRADDHGAAAVAALEHGAVGFVVKPTGPDASANRLQLARDLAVQLEIARRGCARDLRPPGTAQRPIPHPRRGDRGSLVAIGASTGGPQALAFLLPALTQTGDAPIVVVQHMPADFTSSLARSLARRCPEYHVAEATDGAPVGSRDLLIAPGGRHLELVEDQAGLHCRLIAGSPVHGCCPSVDVLFASLVELDQVRPIAVILTGMGSDGSQSLAALARRGYPILAQDRDSSVVWGMPGRAVATGCVDGVHPLAELPAAIRAAEERT